MKAYTRKEIQYPTPSGYITIPKGTECEPVGNLPYVDEFWVQEWEGMTEEAESHHRNYGFLVNIGNVIPEAGYRRIIKPKGFYFVKKDET